MKKRAKENRCLATIVTRMSDKGHAADMPSEHNHPPNPLTVKCRKLRNELRQRSEGRLEPPTVTIRECAKEVSNEVMYFKIHFISEFKEHICFQVQTMVSKPAQRKICQRSRQPAKYPKEPTPGNYVEIPDSFKKTLDGADFLLAVTETALLFSTNDNIRRLSTAKTWMMDGTFATTAPPGFTQIYSILGCSGSGDAARYLPFVFILLTNKSEKTYTSALEELLKPFVTSFLNASVKDVSFTLRLYLKTFLKEFRDAAFLQFTPKTMQFS